MINTIEFTHNWNGKLFCQNFTTIRLSNPVKYFVGAEVEIAYKKRSLGKGIIRSITTFKLHRLNESMARLDTGYGEHEARQLIHTMYKNKVFDWGAQELMFIVIEQPGKAIPDLKKAFQSNDN